MTYELEEGPPLCTCGHRKDRHGRENFTRTPYCFDGCDCQGYDDGEAEAAPVIQRFVGVVADNPTGPYVRHADYLSLEEAAEQLRDEVETLEDDLETAQIQLQEQASATKAAEEEWRLAAEQRDALADALRQVANLGGNLPDDSLTGRTGPNDAAHRGLMYTEARRISRDALQKAGR